MMPPFLLSPLVGKLVDVVGFEKVSLATCALMLFCGVLTFWLDEPRHEPTPSVGSPRRVAAAANPPPPEPRILNPEPRPLSMPTLSCFSPRSGTARSISC